MASEIKDLFKADLHKAILWQYEQSPNLKALIEYKQRFYDEAVSGFWQKWYDEFYNIDTAENWGLNVWAQILNVELSKEFEPHEKVAFGFGQNRMNFNRGNFGSREGGLVHLTVEQKRTLIRTRYFSLTQAPTLDNINAHLAKYYSRGESKVYVVDHQDMTYITYTFFYKIDGALRFLIDEMDLLPRPSTVKVRVREVGKLAFGFGEERANFATPSNFGITGYENEQSV